ncbi:MAG: DUF1045 domain-containing protein [Pseudomonadota bacterium]
MYDAYERYALYWVPTPDQAISRFGLDWTGWCAETGEYHRRRPVAGAAKTAGLSAGETARHGLHGVLAAPFALAPGRNVWTLEQVIDHVAGASPTIRVPSLRATVIAGRVALVPLRPLEMLDGLIGRTRAALYGLTEREPEPAPSALRVETGNGTTEMTADRFHIPLTDQLDAGMAEAKLEVAEALLERLNFAPFRIGDVALMGDPGAGRPLRVLRRYTLAAAEPTPARLGGLETRGPQLLAGLIERTSPSPSLCFG